MKEKYGFVYLWFDRKHKRYYVGSHWGTEDDGYICSSQWMRRAWERRPQDFKRRVISRVYTSRADLLDEEYRWLQMMRDEELHGVRYYNLNKKRHTHWSEIEPDRRKIGEKISDALTRPETRETIAENTRRSWEDPDVRRQKMASRAETTSDPEWQKRQREIMKEIAARPESRERSSQTSRKNWANSEFVEMKTQEITDRWASEEGREKLTSGMRSAWSDPEKREVRLKKIRLTLEAKKNRGERRKPVSPESIARGIETRRQRGWLAKNREPTE